MPKQKTYLATYGHMQQERRRQESEISCLAVREI